MVKSPCVITQHRVFSKNQVVKSPIVYCNLIILQAVIEEHSSKPRLVMENYPTYLVPDTNCFVDNQEGLRAIVASRDFIVVVPLVGRYRLCFCRTNNVKNKSVFL